MARGDGMLHSDACTPDETHTHPSAHPFIPSSEPIPFFAGRLGTTVEMASIYP